MHDAHLSSPMTRVKRVSIVIGSFLLVAAEILPGLVELSKHRKCNSLWITLCVGHKLYRQKQWWAQVVANNSVWLMQHINLAPPNLDYKCYSLCLCPAAAASPLLSPAAPARLVFEWGEEFVVFCTLPGESPQYVSLLYNTMDWRPGNHSLD